MPKIIVSYDGTHNERDAIALGRVFADAGAEVHVAYVRHAREDDPAHERAVAQEAEQIVARGAELLGAPDAPRHVIVSGSTPDGLRTLAEQEGAELIVFCSDSHTAKGHVSVGNSAERLIDGGPLAIAVAPAGFAAQGKRIARIAATGNDGDGAAEETAHALAERLGGQVVPLTSYDADLIVVGSRPESHEGHVSVSAASEYLIETATAPVLVVPRGSAIHFGAAVALGA